MHLLESKMLASDYDTVRLRARFYTAISAVLALIGSPSYCESTAPPTTEGPVVIADGTVRLPAVDLPLSVYMSEKAKRRFIDEGLNPPYSAVHALGENPPISRLRTAVDDVFRPLVERAKAAFPVSIVEQRIAGVRTDVVISKDGLSARNRDRVLINIHQGGGIVGAGFAGLAESIPIASVGKFKVIAIDYRLAPEYRFPAVIDDVVAVYSELLKTYRPQNIGIFGLSHGGKFTAQAVARLEQEKLPLPGAIGIFGSSLYKNPGGDSFYISGASDVTLGGLSRPLPTPPNSILIPETYLNNVELHDQTDSPGLSQLVLAKFPPALFMAGTRDSFMSAASHDHAELVKAGVVADLHIWEGMGHEFLLEMDLPESQDAYGVIAKFFGTHLGARHRN
jgi:epsilon-lactone hydrolase